MTQQEQANEFLATAVNTMDSETKAAWDSLSQFERKTIAATAFFFQRDYNQAQRSNEIRDLRFANLWGE